MWELREKWKIWVFVLNWQFVDFDFEMFGRESDPRCQICHSVTKIHILSFFLTSFFLSFVLSFCLEFACNSVSLQLLWLMLAVFPNLSFYCLSSFLSVCPFVHLSIRLFCQSVNVISLQLTMCRCRTPFSSLLRLPFQKGGTIHLPSLPLWLIGVRVCVCVCKCVCVYACACVFKREGGRARVQVQCVTEYVMKSMLSERDRVRNGICIVHVRVCVCMIDFFPFSLSFDSTPPLTTIQIFLLFQSEQNRPQTTRCDIVEGASVISKTNSKQKTLQIIFNPHLRWHVPVRPYLTSHLPIFF